MIITIDGPAGTGKSTVAKRLAEVLGFLYYDTGALYRAATLYVLREGVSLEDEERIAALLRTLRFEIRRTAQGVHFFIGEEDVTEAIRSPAVTQAVSAVSALASVRSFFKPLQRRFGETHDAVFEGRDMGTVIFPDADVKIFLTASPEVRARRRHAEGIARGEGYGVEEVQRALERRDSLDSTRAHAPLKQPEDAYCIDTSERTIDEVVALIRERVPR